MSLWRSRWAAVGAAIAITLGGGGIGLVNAIDSGDKPVVIAIQPQRIMDTRGDLGLEGRFVSGIARELQVTGEVPVAAGGTATVVPSDAVGVLINVTVVRADGPGFLTVAPGGASGVPTTSTLNFAAGTVEPNAATVDLGADGTIQVYLFTGLEGGTADVLVDVVGYTVDHTHDDRYFTEGEIDALIDNVEGAPGPQGPTGPQGPAGPSGPPGTTGPFDGSDIVNDSLTAADISDESGLAYTTNRITNEIDSVNPGVPNVVSIVSIEAPRAGLIKVSTSGIMYTVLEVVACSLLEAAGGVAFDDNHAATFGSTDAGQTHNPLSLHKTFEADSAGTYTYYLACYLLDSSNDPLSGNLIELGELTAEYFSTSYLP